MLNAHLNLVLLATICQDMSQSKRTERTFHFKNVQSEAKRFEIQQFDRRTDNVWSQYNHKVPHATLIGIRSEIAAIFDARNERELLAAAAAMQEKMREFADVTPALTTPTP